MFTGSVVGLVGLLEITLAGKTARLCDGGVIYWGANKFSSWDADFGSVATVDETRESIDDEAPGGSITLLPPATTSADELFIPTAQGKPIKFWLGEYVPATGVLIGTPNLIFDGLIDTVTLTSGKGRRVLEIGFMAAAEKLFMVREGNVLSPRFHKVAWPGELGFNHATGVQSLVPWGVAGPGRGTVFGSIFYHLRDSMMSTAS